MNNLIPCPLRVVDFYEDGLDSLHFEFQILDYDSRDTNLEETSEIQAGQFFMLSVPGVGEAPFTYVSKPNDAGHFYSLVRKVGTLTESLWSLKRDDIVGYRGPIGNGWPVSSSSQQSSLAMNTLVIAGGCGLAPLAGWLNEQESPPDSVALLYGSRDKASQVLNKELLKFKESLTVFEVFDNLESGYIHGNPISQLDQVLQKWGKQPHRVLICGPEIMMHAVAKQLNNDGVPGANIWLSLERRMHCGVGTCGHCYVANSYICKNGPVYLWSELNKLIQR